MSQPNRTGLVLVLLYGGQIVSVVVFVSLAFAGFVPAWAGWTAGLIFAGSFVVPELLGPLPLVVAAVATVWSVAVVVEQVLIA